MSRAQFCDMGSPRRSNESNAPYFRKRLTSAMLERSERLVSTVLISFELDLLHELLVFISSPIDTYKCLDFATNVCEGAPEGFRPRTR